jgi:hypothetical protein
MVENSNGGSSRAMPVAAAADAERCEACGGELSVIRITVDDSDLLMQSCNGCDARRWQLAGKRIELQEALSQVGEHAGRRR